jgi:hypothetical protein
MATKTTTATKQKPEAKSDWSIDEAGIQKYSKALVAQVLSPSSLMQYVMDHVQPAIIAHEPEELNLLRAALDSRYPEFRKRYEAGEIKDGDLNLQIIEEQVMYFVGLELGRRVSRD